MRKRRNVTAVVVALATASGLALVTACGSGTGALSTVDDGRDPAPVARDDPGSTRESPVTTGRDAPPTSGNNAGSPAAGGASNSGGTCPPCDVTFDCVSVVGTTTATESIPFTTSNGQCFAGDMKDAIVLDCAGEVLQEGQSIGTWTAKGSGLTAVVNVQGATQTLTCTTATTTPSAPADAGRSG